RVPADFSALTDVWEDEQGPMGSSSKRLILFAPDGPGWSDISAVWENVVHNPSQAGGGLSEGDYGTIIDSIGNSVRGTGRKRPPGPRPPRSPGHRSHSASISARSPTMART